LPAEEGKRNKELTSILNTGAHRPKGPLCAGNFVFEIDFMVKLLRACVWMPWRKEAKKDVVSCDKPREDANSQ
jgi:hypothetical protein